MPLPPAGATSPAQEQANACINNLRIIDGAKQTWAVFSAEAGRVALEPLPADLAAQACLSEQEVRYICQQAAAIEAAEAVEAAEAAEAQIGESG